MVETYVPFSSPFLVGIKPKILCTPDKHSTTKLFCHPFKAFILVFLTKAVQKSDFKSTLGYNGQQ